MNPQIDEYDDRYRQGVIDVILPIQREEFSLAVTLEDQPDLIDVPAYYQSGKGGFWVATVGGKVVGTLGLLDIGDGCGALRKMFVAQEWRGRAHAIADRLLERLLAHARSQRIDRIYLGTTRWFHAAHRYYERNGFSRIRRADLPSSFPIMKVDTRFYRRVLPAAGPPS